MMPTTIRSPPSVADYTPLSEYQSQTPETFHGGNPVLHYHAIGAKAWIPKSQRGNLPFFPADLASEPTGPESSVLNGASEDLVEQAVDLFVTSETFTIFCPNSESGIAIPYQSITLHAIKNLGSGDQSYQSVYLQLDFSDGAGDDETFDTLELTIVPPARQEPAATATDSDVDPQTETSKLFGAISDCSNLHPDPVDDSEDEDGEDRIVFEGDHHAVEGFSGVFVGSSDGGLPPPLPGSSGWITAENVHEYFDGEGNWIGEGGGVNGELGEGAGRVHEREEADADDANGQGVSEDGDNKRPRTD